MVKKAPIFKDNITGSLTWTSMRAQLKSSQIEGKNAYYTGALSIAEEAKSVLECLDVERFEIFLALQSCGITRQRFTEIVCSDGSKNITEDEAKRLVEKCLGNSYIFDTTRRIALQMVGKCSLPPSLAAFIRYYLSGNFKKPTRKPPKNAKKYVIITFIGLIKFNYKSLSDNEATCAMAKGLGETQSNILKIWNERDKTDRDANSGTAYNTAKQFFEFQSEIKAKYNEKYEKFRREKPREFKIIDEMYLIKDDNNISDSDAICATAKKLDEKPEYIKKIWENVLAEKLSRDSKSLLCSKFEAEYTLENFRNELESINKKNINH